MKKELDFNKAYKLVESTNVKFTGLQGFAGGWNILTEAPAPAPQSNPNLPPTPEEEDPNAPPVDPNAPPADPNAAPAPAGQNAPPAAPAGAPAPTDPNAAPVDPNAPPAAPAPEGGAATGEDGQPQPEEQGAPKSASNPRWESIKNTPEFKQYLNSATLQQMYKDLGDRDMQNSFVKSAVGPVIKAKFIGDPNSNIPYNEIHEFLGGTPAPEQGAPEQEGAEEGQEGQQEAPAPEAQPEAAPEEQAPQQGQQQMVAEALAMINEAFDKKVIDKKEYEKLALHVKKDVKIAESFIKKFSK